MEIELNTSRIPPLPQASTVQRTREVPPPRDDAQFKGTEALTQAMAKLPETRPEVVHQAKQLVGSVKYPPEQTLSRIANLLAMHLGKD